jgi:2-polyprenyl-3-methyl-5-hydroxy-6-metoxy-1,4-benzoquinol methylase
LTNQVTLDTTHDGPERDSRQDARTRVLVAIASYGRGNDGYLGQLLAEYRAMPFDVDIVVLSNIDKNLGPGVEMRVGLPSKNPWSLPFAHKTLFAERADKYDVFVYSEDDILITEAHLRAFLEVTAELADDELAGYLRIEKQPDGRVSFPDVHWNFHWKPQSLKSRGQHFLARFTNEHAACYVLTRQQLAKAIRSGGFLVEPHEEKYDLLCTAATDPYTQCGFTKLIPISRLGDFTVHHLSNKYAGRMGVDEPEMQRQIAALRQLAGSKDRAVQLFETETRLPRAAFSKDYYELPSSEVMALVPDSARTILSIGCGWGATEMALAGKGLKVTAIPLDSVVSAMAADSGVEMIHGDFRAARARLEGRHFDCVLCLNVLHLVADPVGVLSLFGDVLSAGAPVIIQSPNMRSIPEIWHGLRSGKLGRQGGYERTGAHPVSAGKLRSWCADAGFVTAHTVGIPHRRAGILRHVPNSRIGMSMATDVITVARKAGVSARSAERRSVA